MAEAMPVYSSLLTRFAAFYEDVAQIKLAVQKGDIGRLLQPETPHASMEPHVLAEQIAHRLLDVLDRQQQEVTATATDMELEAYRHARYVMVSLADEIFILNLAWPGAEHWPVHLLEYTVERTRMAGRQFFVLAKALVDCRAPTALDIEFAAVLLLALQLGFRGMYRGDDGRRTLADYRNKLYKLASAGALCERDAHAFAQAYDYTVASDRDNTRIALAPWIRAATYGALGYLLLSSLVWVVLTWSLLGAIARAL